MHPFLDLPLPIPIGHRGAAGEEPENTLPSFERALALGATILETDVHLSADGHVVVHHDELVDRTTEGRGPIVEKNLAELQALDAGFRFAPGESGETPRRGQGVRIPSLEQVFAAFPEARFNIEIKAPDPRLVERTLDLAKGRADRTLLAAANPAIMENLRATVRRRAVDVAIGASAADVLAFVKSALDGVPPPPGPMALQVPTDFAGRALVTPEFVAHAHAHGIHVHVWTINDPAEIERLLDLGVDGLVSDFPGRVVAAAERRAAG